MNQLKKQMATKASNQLKDFQVSTVDYVFQRFMDINDPCNRFLVADEVGLGKTLVARGIIQRLFDYYISINKTNLNVIYICSNQSIASQNINKLNIDAQKGSLPPRINRINELAITKLNTAHNSFLQIIAFSPNTSFNVSGGGGIVKERAILYFILSNNSVFSFYRKELLKILRMDVGDATYNNYFGINSEIKGQLRIEIIEKYNDKLNNDGQFRYLYDDLLTSCIEGYSRNKRKVYSKLIGGLRKLLASICVGYLQPDLIILDEFQRFKYLIDRDEDNEVKLITESLFSDTSIKILLLSATPYRMYTLQSDDEKGDSHFEEFKFIVDFLLNSPQKKIAFIKAWENYSKSLLHIDEHNWNLIKEEKEKVETLLRSIIARTERITVSDDKNTMLRSTKSDTIWIKPEDIRNFISTDTIAKEFRDIYTPVEFCKSSPFPFSFMEKYVLQRKTLEEIAKGNLEVRNILAKCIDSFLPIDKMNDYEAFVIPNAKLKYLIDNTLSNGGSDLLWIPPSLPYYEFESPFDQNRFYSKTLIFSSWIMVPKMIATLTSYECERLTIGDTKSIANSEERSERKYFNRRSERHPKARLRFRIDRGSFSMLSIYSLLYPCITLSDLWKPKFDNQRLSDLIEETMKKIQQHIDQIDISDFITEPLKKDDDRWTLIYMLLLDRENRKDKLDIIKDSEDEVDWDWFHKDEENSIASEYYYKVFIEILFAESPKFIPAWMLQHGAKTENPIRQVLYDLKLGKPPDDIVKQLAYLTIASPAICAYRLLSSFLAIERNLDYCAFYGAFRIADSFRKYFNISENIAVIDKFPAFNTYWKNVLAYSASGNFQAMLDEYANLMIDHNGLWDYELGKKLSKLINIVAENIGLRTVSVTGHTYDSFIRESKPEHFRCHFGVALNHSLINEKDVLRSDNVRNAFNSPFRPFILATTSIGQEGLDFHLYCRKILHWNLPANPVEFEQREGRINRYKNLAIRQNIAVKYRDRIINADSATIWDQLYRIAIENEKGNKSDLVPYWHVEPENIFIERHVPMIPYSKEVRKLKNLLRTVSVYRIALGQPRQEELVKYLIENFDKDEIEKVQAELLINLSPYKLKL